MKAYYKVIDFIKDRSKGIDALLPTKSEIQVLEVFKKLTESGWIVRKAEFKQILDFVGISVEDFEASEQLSKYIKMFSKQIGLSVAEICEIL